MAAFSSYNDRFKSEKHHCAWLSKDEKVWEFCANHKYCNFIFTVNGYKTLFDVLTYIQKKGNIKKIPKKLPIFMVAGTDDPVGDYGSGVQKIYETYKQTGIEDIRLKLYEKDRHEILNELDKDVVYNDIYKWLEEHM